MKIIAVIPARSGSKSVKDKNIHIYKRKPLIFHSIKIAKKLTEFLFQQILKNIKNCQ